MLRNYLKIAWRNLARQKGYSFINIVGLTIGLACCLIIFQYVTFEYSFDGFHENKDSVYRITMELEREGDYMGRAAFTPQAMGPAMAQEIPEIQHYTRVHPEYSGAVISNPERPDRTFEEEDMFYVDPAFLQMFTFPLVAGSEERALEPGTLLISESAAEKHFGSENPIGQVLDVTGQTEQRYRVTGIFQDVPANSHLKFDFLLPVENLLQVGQYADEPEGGWWSNNFATYIQLHQNADQEVVNQKMTDVFLNHRGAALQEQGFGEPSLHAQPLGDVYLNAEVEGPPIVAGSYQTLYFILVIGLVTLLIALVNYVNLATARAMDRAREVGVRKAVGARRGQLMRQFLFESALTNIIAAALAVYLAVLLTPLVNRLAGVQLTGELWLNPGFWIAFLVTFGAATVLAGLYPAFVLSSFQPVKVLKGRARSFAAQLWLRKGLVVFQFAAAVVLVAGTAVVYSQLQYMRSLDLGLDLEQVVTIQGPRVLPDGTDPASARTTLGEELRQLPGVRQVGTSWSLPGQGFNWNGASTWRAEEEQATAIRAVVTYIDTSFVSLYGLELVVGRNFDETSTALGATSPSPVLANETAVSSLGFASPDEALDHPLFIDNEEVRIVGVLQDFNWTSAHTERENIFFGYTTAGGHLSLRVETANLPQTISDIEQVHASLFPGNPFSYSFVDERFDQQYRTDRRFAQLFAIFAGLAIFIACLGLFGLAAFASEQRRKEIGIRKVLGATAQSVVALLSKDFLKLVIAALIIGFPVAYYAMSRWLEDFAYRIDIGPGVFILTGIIALAIALLTVSYQALRAAWMNPTEAIRTE